jgi:pantothenate synthetase
LRLSACPSHWLARDGNGLARNENSARNNVLTWEENKMSYEIKQTLKGVIAKLEQLRSCL